MRLSDILPSGDNDGIGNLWDASQVADDFGPLPAGNYTCHIIDGKLEQSRRGTPGYKLTFKVLEPSDYAGRLLWLDCWLTAAAMPGTKRDLGKLGVQSLHQLENPLPRFFRVRVRVVVRKDDDGTERNQVKSFEVVSFDQEMPDPFAPADDFEPSSSDKTGGDATPAAGG